MKQGKFTPLNVMFMDGLSNHRIWFCKSLELLHECVCGFNVHLMGVPRGSEKHVAATVGRKK
jgi:hypothetical protein